MKFTSIVLAFVVAANQFSSTSADTSVGVDDSATTYDGKSVVITVLDNDTFDDGDGNADSLRARVDDGDISTLSIEGTPNIAITSAAGTFTAGDFSVVYGNQIAGPPAAGTALPTITFNCPNGFVGTVTFDYQFTANDGTSGDTQSGTTTVTVKILADVKDTFTNPFAIASSKAPEQTQNGLRGAFMFLTGGASPAQLNNGLDQVINPKTDLSNLSVINVNENFKNLQAAAGPAFKDFKPSFNEPTGNPFAP
jgi:hypothetical protein